MAATSSCLEVARGTGIATTPAGTLTFAQRSQSQHVPRVQGYTGSGGWVFYYARAESPQILGARMRQQV